MDSLEQAKLALKHAREALQHLLFINDTLRSDLVIRFG